MNRNVMRGVMVGWILLMILLFLFGCEAPHERPRVVPVPVPIPVRPRPHQPRCEAAPAEAKVGGRVSPDGADLQCDLPGEMHCRNVSSRGQGCCVQTSINHAARWQGIPALVDFHKWVQQKGLPGGAYPGAVDQRIPACCKDRGFPVVPYLQVENADFELIRKACASGRMVSATYSRSPTGRYGGQRIAHMVSVPHCDEKALAVLDNNYPGSATDENVYEWMTPDEFKRICNGNGPIWVVILLPNGVPPRPSN